MKRSSYQQVYMINGGDITVGYVDLIGTTESPRTDNCGREFEPKFKMEAMNRKFMHNNLFILHLRFSTYPDIALVRIAYTNPTIGGAEIQNVVTKKTDKLQRTLWARETTYVSKNDAGQVYVEPFSPWPFFVKNTHWILRMEFQPSVGVNRIGWKYTELSQAPAAPMKINDKHLECISSQVSMLLNYQWTQKRNSQESFFFGVEGRGLW